MPSVFFLLWLRDSSQLHYILFTGPHTGTEIKAKSKQICLEFEIFDNVAYIISASASNMSKAFFHIYIDVVSSFSFSHYFEKVLSFNKYLIIDFFVVVQEIAA